MRKSQVLRRGIRPRRQYTITRVRPRQYGKYRLKLAPETRLLGQFAA
jgi:hypothetical protein